MAAHFSILVWRISWTEESDGLQSTVLQRVRYDWVADKHTDGNLYQAFWDVQFGAMREDEGVRDFEVKDARNRISIWKYIIKHLLKK